MSGNLVPASRFSHESWVKNSRFISHISPAFTVPQAKFFIERINLQYSDATHNVPVYLVGSGASTIEHASDDGEPSGTAGRPALAVLKGSGLGDTVLVITRYFGGTKLGTGGLVRAYGSAARFAVDLVPKAVKIAAYRVEFNIHYRLYDQVLRLIKDHQGVEIEEEFTEIVALCFSIPADKYQDFNTGLLELSNGQAACKITNNDQTLLQQLPKS